MLVGTAVGLTSVGFGWIEPPIVAATRSGEPTITFSDPDSRISPRADTTHRDTTHRDTASHDTASHDTTHHDTTHHDTTSQATPPEAGAWQEDAWNEIAVVRGVQFAYLYYIEADHVNDGVVVRLHNRSNCTATVGFDVIFRAAPTSGMSRERVVEEHYRLEPGESKTGENDGLFYIPFPEGDSIAEVGLRGVSVQRLCR